MMQNPVALCVALIVALALLVVGWLVLGPLVAVYTGLLLTAIGMAFMVGMLITFPKDADTVDH